MRAESTVGAGVVVSVGWIVESSDAGVVLGMTGGAVGVGLGDGAGVAEDADCVGLWNDNGVGVGVSSKNGEKEEELDAAGANSVGVDDGIAVGSARSVSIEVTF